MAASDDPAGPLTGTPGTRNQWRARRWTCPSRAWSRAAYGTRTRRSRLVDARRRAADFEKPDPQLVEHLFDHLALLGCQIAAGFFLEQRQDGDHLRRTLEVGLEPLARPRVRHVAEMNRRRGGE